MKQSKTSGTHKKIESNKKCFSQYFKRVLENSSVHGLKQIILPDRHPAEQILWTFWVILCLLGAVTVSLSTWKRYRDNPTVISMERNYLEWNTTFPSAAICPTNKFDPQLLEEKARQLFPENVEKGEEFLKALAESSLDKLTIPDSVSLDPSLYLSTILDIKFNFSYTMTNSNSRSITMRLAVTEMGLCYYYNSVAALYNEPSYWKSDNWTLVENIDVFVGNPLDGDIFAQVMEMNSPYRVWMQSPAECLDPSGRWTSSQESYYTSADLTAVTIYPSPALKSLRLAQRKCRYPKESNLLISPYYSYSFCRMQCRIKLSQSLCSCIPHFYRPIKGYRICDAYGLKCLSRYKDILMKLRDGKKKIDCDCYPPCEEVIYSIQSDSSVPWFLGTNFKYGLVKYPRFRLKRDILFGITDLLVQFGGTAGLFLGCSVLSIFEIIYFGILRPACFYIYKKFKT